MGEPNVAEPITLQKFINADIDADTLGDAVNADKMITSRSGLTYASAPMATRLILEQGTIDATIFATRTLMETSVLLDNAYALVTDDIIDVNNGYYQKRAGVWFYLKYNVFPKVNDIEREIYDTYTLTQTPDYTLSSGDVNEVGVINQPNYAGYVMSTPFFLRKGDRLNFDYYGWAFSALSETDMNLSFIKPIVKVGRTGKNETGTVDYIAESDIVVVICSNTSALPLNLTLSRLANKKNVLSKGDIASHTTTGGYDKVASAESVKIISDYISKTKPIDISTEVGGFVWTEGVQISDFPVQGKEVALVANDVLTFDYTPIDGVTLWLWADSNVPTDANKGIPLLSSSITSTEVKSHTFTAVRPTKLRIVNSINGSIKINAVTPTIINLGVWGITQYPNPYPFLNYKRTLPINVQKGDLITVTNPSSGAISILRQTANGQYKSVVAQSIKEPNNTIIAWRADANLTIKISGKSDSEFLINKAGESLEQKLASFAPNAHDVPLNIVLPEKEFVFATTMNYVLKTEVIGGADYIKISQDLGKTWTQMPNILGDIVAYHFFADGTIMLCSPTKVYWTRDYLTLNESIVYDHDGSLFVPTGRHFFGMQTGDAITYVGDTEIYAWGDYVVDGTPARIWYSVDRGRTIKCAAKFGTTVMDGAVRPARHTHRVYQRSKDESFYINTGDDGNENMIIRAVYNVESDSWNWKVLASGIDYKFGNIIIDDHFAYLMTDYTEPAQVDKKGVYRVVIPDIGDITKYQLVYKTQPSEWGAIAPVNLLLDNHGNKVILPDYLGAGFIWIARDGLDFKKVSVSPAVLLTYTIGANYKGDIYCVAYNNSGELNTQSQLKLNRGTYNLTKALRAAGINDFMRGTNMINGLTNVF